VRRCRQGLYRARHGDGVPLSCKLTSLASADPAATRSARRVSPGPERDLISSEARLTLTKRFSGVYRAAMVMSDRGEPHPQSPFGLPRTRAPSAAPPRLGLSQPEDPMLSHRGYDPIQMVAIAVGVVIVVAFAIGL
jgi:hypothetical protein